MKIFFSVGEPSGDQHAAHLIAELRKQRPDVDCCGLGGPLMEAAGCRVHFRLTDLAVMGFLKVIPMIGKFLRVLRKTKTWLAEEQPDAVVLVDFPGFNWKVAKRAHALGIPVYYYLPPQLWAWAPWRIKRVHKWVTRVLCGLPFEYEWYIARDVKADFVGHPFFDDVAEKQLDAQFLLDVITTTEQPAATLPISTSVASSPKNEGTPSRRRPIVGVLPGSRGHEIEYNMPLMLDVLRDIVTAHPDVKLLVAGYKPQHVERVQELLAESGYDLPLEFHVDKTSEIIEAADCCLMVSGSVSLEMLARTTPAAVVYRLDRFYTLVKKWLVHVKYISLPNLMADHMVLPEWLVSGDPTVSREEIAGTINGWLTDPATLAAAASELKLLRDSTVRRGATTQTAKAILRDFPVVQRDAA